MNAINSDEALIMFVSKLKTDNNCPRHSVTARKCFDELYTRAREIVAQVVDAHSLASLPKHPVQFGCFMDGR